MKDQKIEFVITKIRKDEAKKVAKDYNFKSLGSLCRYLLDNARKHLNK